MIAVLVRIDGVGPLRLAGIALGFVGVYLLVGPTSAAGGATSVFWLLLGLLIPLCYAAENNILAIMRPQGVDDLTLLTGMLVFGAVAILPVVLLTGTFADLTLPPGRVEWATLGFVGVNIVSYASFIYLVRVTGPVFASQSGYLVVVVGVAVGMVVYGERHSVWVWLAVVLLLSGMMLVKERVHRRVSTR